MRTIKFRAWITEPGRKPQMVNDVGIIPEGESNYPMNITSHGIYVNPFCEWIKIMQYTGLKDKNGKEIYEGDILESKNKKFECVWAGAGFKFQSDKDRGWSTTSTNSLEIIGNIHENPKQ